MMMKKVQLSPHVWRLSSWLVVPINVWVVVEKQGVTLIDADIPSMAKGIVQFIEQLGAGPLTKVLLTHGHVDHVGALAHIRRTYDVPVYVHRKEIQYMEGQLPYPRRKKAAATVPPALVQPLEMDESRQLLPVGDLTPYFSPGHAPGHVVYYHKEDDVLLAGDLCTTFGGKLRRPMPMFTSNMAQAIASCSLIDTLQPHLLSICHGKEIYHPHEKYAAFHKRWHRLAVTVQQRTGSSFGHTEGDA